VPLFETAYLVVEDATTTAEFELEIGLEHTSELTKSYLMGERGQYIREIVNKTPLNDSGVDENTFERRKGYWIDGGAGNWQQTLGFETGLEDVTWGDGSGGTGPGNVTETDASGADVKPLSRYQVFEFWMAQTLTDSNTPARLYVGEWSDGTYAAEAGAYNRPMTVAVVDHTVTNPVDESGSLEGSITVALIAPWPTGGIPDWLSGDSITDFVSEVSDALDLIPDE